MSREGPAYGSGVVRVGDLLLQVAGKTVLSKPVYKVKRLILGAPGTSCEFVFKRWTHGGDESVIYSLTMKRQPAANAGEDAPADGAWVLFQQAVGSLLCVPSRLHCLFVASGGACWRRLRLTLFGPVWAVGPASNPRRGEIPSPPASRGAGHSDVLVLALPAQADGWQSAHPCSPGAAAPCSPGAAAPCSPGAAGSGRRNALCEAQAGHLSPLGLLRATTGRAEETEGGLGIVFRVGKDGGMYVKSMLPEGAAFRSSVVQVRESTAANIHDL